MVHSHEYASDFDEEIDIRRLGEQIKVATAHAELLNFFASCSDQEDDDSKLPQAINRNSSLPINQAALEQH